MNPSLRFMAVRETRVYSKRGVYVRRWAGESVCLFQTVKHGCFARTTWWPKWRLWLCPKSLTIPYIVHYIVTTPFCSAVRMSSGKYYILYSALKVSNDALQKVVYNQWSLTKQYLPSCNVLRSSAWRFQFTFQLYNSSDVINGAWVVSESVFFFLPMSSLYSPLCWTPCVVTRE